MKGRTTTDVSRVLKKCAEFFEDVSEADFARFLDGTLKLALLGPEGERSAEEGDDRSRRGPVELNQIAERLRAAASREEALRLLHNEEQMTGRNDLAQLARYLRIHVTKQDKRDSLGDKIIEAVIGVRLRSEAIQDVNLKSASGAGRGPVMDEERARSERGGDREGRGKMTEEDLPLAQDRGSDVPPRDGS